MSNASTTAERSTREFSLARALLPEGWPRPPGYANGMIAEGRQIYVAGVVGWDAQGRFHSDRFADQLRQVLENTVEILHCGGAGPEHIVRMTWYITDREEYNAQLKDVGRVYRAVIGKHFPAMAVVQVVALMEPRAKVEIETTAVIPSDPAR